MTPAIARRRITVILEEIETLTKALSSLPSQALYDPHDGQETLELIIHIEHLARPSG